MATREPAARPEEAVEPIRIDTQGEQDVLHLEGVVGVMQAKRLQQVALQLAGSGHAVSVRCEHLQYLDCAGAQILLALRESLERKQVRMTLVNLPDSIHQTLLTAGLASAF